MVVVVRSSAARTNCDYIDYYIINDDGDDVINHDVALQSSFEILNFRVDFGIGFWILTPYRVESIGKTSIFGLDNTTNR